MLGIGTLTKELRKRILDNDMMAVLAWGESMPIQVGGASGAALLLEFLDRTRPFTAERDQVLAQLLRCLRTTRSPSLQEVVLYALIPSIRRTLRRLRKTWKAPQGEILADVLAATLEALHSYDPDRRSAHVQANMELDILNAFHRRWQGENNTTVAKAVVLLLVRDGEQAAWPDLDGSWVFPGVPAKPRKREELLTTEDRALGQALLGELLEQGLLTQEEMHLLESLSLGNRSATAIAKETGVDRRTVVRRVERIRARIRPAFAALLGE